MSATALTKDQHRNIIKAKIGSFMLSSPIDTWRQNKLLLKPLTPGKIARGVVSSSIASTVISVPCHYSMIHLDNMKINGVVSFAIGIMVANLFKVPAVFYHKRCQTGMALRTVLPKSIWKNVIKLSIIEDLIEEGAKNHFSKLNMNSSEEVKRETVILQGLTLFMLAYPFDVLKNRSYYNTALKISKNDFAKKALYKNFQNMSFLSLIHA